MTTTPIYKEIEGQPNTYIRAQIDPNSNGEFAQKALLKLISKDFAELVKTEFDDTQIHATVIENFPQVYQRLEEKLIAPAFNFNKYLQPIEGEMVKKAISFESAYVGPKLCSKYLVVSPRATPSDLVEQLQRYAKLVAEDVLMSPTLVRDQTLADGFTLHTHITRVPSKYFERTPKLDPVLLLNVVNNLRTGMLATVITTAKPPIQTTEYDVDNPLECIHESLKAYRLDFNARFLFLE